MLKLERSVYFSLIFNLLVLSGLLISKSLSQEIFANTNINVEYKNDLLEISEELLIRATGKNYELIKPVNIALDDNYNIYVLDKGDNSIKVFDRLGRFIRVIGRAGEGPGELDGLSDIFISKNELGVNCGIRRKLIFFSLDGKFKRSISMPISLSQVAADEHGEIFGITLNRNEKYLMLQLVCFNESKSIISRIASRRWKEPAPFTAVMTFGLLKNSQIVIGNPENGYEVYIVNKHGKQLKTISKKHKDIKIPDAIINKLLRNGPSPYEIPKYYEPYYRIFNSDDGVILVEVHDKISEEAVNYFDVFNIEGRNYGNIKIMDSMVYLWANKRLYTLEDDREGFKTVKVYAVRWNFYKTDH